MKTFSYQNFLLLIAALLLLTPVTAAAQDAGLTLSKNDDFSTVDREFEIGEVVHVRVTAPDVDASDLETNELRVAQANADGGSIVSLRLSLENNLDGTYTATLDSLGPGVWYLRAVVADSKGAAFEGDARFVIGDDDGTNPPEIRVDGTITELGEQSLVVSERTFFVNPNTEVFDESGAEIRFSDLRIGDEVVIHFTVSFTGELVAKKIIRRGEDDHAVELRGRIRELGDSFFVVLERKVVVDSSTVIFDEYGQPIRFAQLAVNDVVAVKGYELDNGDILAAVVKREDSHDDEVRFSGFISEIGERTLVVLGRTLIVDDQTLIATESGEPFPFSSLIVGMFVNVVAEVGPNDFGLLARKIIVKEDSRFVVEGEIEELGERALVVAGIPFRVVEDTEIVTSTGVQLRFSDLREGFKVTVFGTATDVTNQLVALRIVVHRPSIEVRTITGFIHEIDGDLIVVNNAVIRVVDRTEILDVNGEKIRYDDLEVGMRVRVSAVAFVLATNVTDRVLVAERIRVLPDREKRVVGRIREVSNEKIKIASVEAAITADTEILDRNGDPITANDLMVGALAAMHVVETPSGVVATKIRLLPRLEDEVGVAGVLEAIEDSAVVVLGQTFYVLPNTVARDENGNRIRVTDLEIGKPVALRGELLAGGTLVALHIQQLAREVRGIKVLGPIESIGQTTIEVIGIHFFVDANTKIFDLNRNEVALSDMKIGQTVLVNAEGQPDGTRLAKTIQLLDVTVSSGDLTLTGSGSIAVLGAQYTLAPDALVVTDDNVALDAAALADGMYVEVRGSRVDEATFTITKVKILSGQVVGTDGPGVDTLPRSVELRPNYPNPFATSTTIAFDLSEGAAGARTTLSVFDLTGRHVRTLVDASLVPGSYTAAWDGRDDAGKPVASGVYFYRVRSGDTSTARTMMLVK